MRRDLSLVREARECPPPPPPFSPSPPPFLACQAEHDSRCSSSTAVCVASRGNWNKSWTKHYDFDFALRSSLTSSPWCSWGVAFSRVVRVKKTLKNKSFQYVTWSRRHIASWLGDQEDSKKWGEYRCSTVCAQNSIPSPLSWSFNKKA